MPDVLKVTAVWQGFIGAPGYSQFHFGPGGGSVTEAADSATGAVRAFFFSLVNLLPTPVTVQVNQEVPLFDSADGTLSDVANASAAPALVTGSSSVTYATPAGAAITWLTGTIRGTHRLRGRTYLVPLANNAFQSDGTLAAASIVTINNAANALRATAATPFQVWGRPSAALGPGVVSAVTGQLLRDKAAVLTTRRD